MFTANPANGRRDQAVISAAWGLGEAVVSGAVDTDNLVVAKADGRVITRSTADKAIMTRYAAAGTAEREVAPDLRREPVLDDQAAAELTALGTRIEAHFGAPQDIEWARAAGETSSSCSPVRSPHCRCPRPIPRPTGACPTGPRCTSGPASSSSSRIR